MKKVIDDLKAGKEVKPGPQMNRNFSEGPQGRTCLHKIPKPEFRDMDALLKEKNAE